MSKQDKQNTSRRTFLRNSTILVAGSTVAGNLEIARAANGYGTDTIKIGLVGCGGRGTGAAIQALNTQGGGLELVAMGDVFEDRVQGALRGIKSKHPDKVKVTADTTFTGFDAYKQVLASDIDLVILATPPGFRPLHFEAAVNAGVHVFMEKPVAVDAPGVRRVLDAGEIAKQKNLAVGVGLQRRHEQRYKETMARLHDGAIGDIVLGRAYWNSGGVWVRPRQDNQTELEYQMRNWYYFNWLCGDHINEQHIHNIDVINWLMNDFPVSAQAMGGREVRNGIDHGEIYDHHFVEFTYANGTKMFSQCRHIPNCWNNVTEHAHGTSGYCDIAGGKIYDADGNKTFDTREADVNGGNGHQQEHHDLFADLRAGRIPNEAEYGAKSTMTAILGRMASYSGRVIQWDKALQSDLKLADVDNLTAMDNPAPLDPKEDGSYKIPVPGGSTAGIL
ncbi:MAG: Gfo/Idh/MocA family oxidoreductase [Pirellulales bacterium]|nr:Gfo/Idh/MocA family oxidoreductase [Pirellulales bacterium]|tara:strand:- start:11996 stop:13336 length:1341 start_codon:yes stop_codon:yes gene_type:complete